MYIQVTILYVVCLRFKTLQKNVFQVKILTEIFFTALQFYKGSQLSPLAEGQCTLREAKK